MMLFSRGIASALLQDLGGHAGADGAAAFADRKPQLLLHRDRRDQLARHLRVVPRHHHLHPRRQLHRPRHVRRPQIKLRPIPLEERRMPPAFFLGQDVHLALKLRVRRDALRLRQHHPPLHLVLLDAPEQEPDVVPRLPLIQQLPEHLHPPHHHLLVRPQPHHPPFPTPALSPAIAFKADPRITGTSSPGYSYLLRSSRTSSSTRSNSSASSTRSHLFKKTTIAGTFTCRASKMCSRVCGIGPSTAETTRIAPSICAAPVIMFFT